MSIWTPGNFAVWCFSSTLVIADFGLSHGWIGQRVLAVLAHALDEVLLVHAGRAGIDDAIGSQRCLTISCTISLASLRRQIGISISALLALALATSTDRSLAAAS